MKKAVYRRLRQQEMEEELSKGAQISKQKTTNRRKKSSTTKTKQKKKKSEK